MAKEITKQGKAARTGLTNELTLPEGVTASLTGKLVKMKGPKGETSREVTEPSITVSVEGSKVLIASSKSAKNDKTKVGSWRAHIANMVKGVTEGHVYRLKVCYTHFPINIAVSGKKIVVKNFLGEKIVKEIALPDNVKARVEGAEVIIESADKENAGQTAALIEQLGKRANYDTRVFTDGIYITMKAGKEIK